jgi:hypothetical protein
MRAAENTRLKAIPSDEGGRPETDRARNPDVWGFTPGAFRAQSKVDTFRIARMADEGKKNLSKI